MSKSPVQKKPKPKASKQQAHANYMPPLPQRKQKKSRKKLFKTAAWLGCLLLVAGVAYTSYSLIVNDGTRQSRDLLTRLVSPQQPQPKFGKVISVEPALPYDAAATKALILQTNKTFNTPITSGIRKQVVRYTSSDQDGNEIPVYARVYAPTNLANGAKLPVFAFAPGTTGIDDRCAASLERPQVANWANYDSLMAAYAAKGYLVIITDYQGMRDAKRTHHYMVGSQEGRAVLDSIRVLKNLDTTKSVVDTSNIFVSGYSQGGHAALWADMLARDYAPELSLKGLVGFGPVSDVRTTLTDITRGANINWFGPFLLTSYPDYYRTNYDTSKYLLPKWQESLTSDIATQCINTVIPHWGKNPAAIYQPSFLSALASGNWGSEYADFARDLDKNRAGTIATATPKLINHGRRDNVVLASQSETLRVRLCGLGGGTTTLKIYPTATHYDTMVQSYNDTLVWMNAVKAGRQVVSSCQ